MSSPPSTHASADVFGYALLFCSLLVPYTYFNHSEGWSQGIRIAQLHAVVQRGTFRIDDYRHLSGDGALIDGHYYSEKAPATFALALPAFAATVWIQELLGVDPDGPSAWRVSEWIATASSMGLVAALGGLAFFAMLRHRFDALTAIIGTYALFLGSLTWPYATTLFAHAGTIGLLSVALWAALGARSRGRDYLAGLGAGLAVASEYPAVIPCVMIALFLGSTELRRMWRFAFGTIPAALLILANNYLTTGSPFEVAYGANATFPELVASKGMGFGWPPKFDVIVGMVWGEYRGLFFWCPALIISAIGIFDSLRRDRAVGIMNVATITMILVLMGCFYGSFGGNAIGPRYLAPALPFIGLAAAYGTNRWPELGLVLVLASIVFTGLVTSIAVDPPGDVLTPFQDFYLVRFRDDRFADNLGTLLGLPLWASLIVPFVIPPLAAWRTLRKPITGRMPSLP